MIRFSLEGSFRFPGSGAARPFSRLFLAGLLLQPAWAGAVLPVPDQSPSDRRSKWNPSAASFRGIPIHFEENHGRTDPQVRFLARGEGYSLFLTPAEAVLVLQRPRGKRSEGARSRSPAAGDPSGPAGTVRMRLVGGDRRCRMTGVDPLPGRSNYFLGKDPEKWRTGLRHFAKVGMEGVYPGIDMFYYGNQEKLEYDFVVGPGADPKAIHLRISGGELSVDGEGGLMIETREGRLTFRAPWAYQEKDGKREVESRYRLLGAGEVGFEIGSYDPEKPLVIDPLLDYSTFLGGTSYEYGQAIAVDQAGSVYVTGYTDSADFPTTPGTYQPAKGFGSEVFLSKLNASGTALVYSTYFGGTSGEIGGDVEVDQAGNAYVAGWTTSFDFPITPGVFQPDFGGGAFSDVFVTKFNAAGSALVYSTYLGGSASDTGRAMDLDPAGNVFVTGYTGSANFPTTPGVLQTVYAGSDDIYVSKLNVDGSALLYSTFLGGNGDEFASDLRVDPSGNAYVAGQTDAGTYPTTAGAFQTISAGLNEAVVSKINAAGTSLIFSTFLGGSSWDSAWGVEVDPLGSVYVTGGAWSPDFPTTPGAYQTVKGLQNDAFVARLNASGSTLIFSTFLGGNGVEGAEGIAVDPIGDVYVSGSTGSSDFPITGGAFQTTFGGGGFDAFLTKLDATGALLYSTYLGGSDYDYSREVVLDPNGNGYIGGETYEADFPTTSGAFQAVFGGGQNDVMVAKFSGFFPTPTPTETSTPPPTATFTPTDTETPPMSTSTATSSPTQTDTPTLAATPTATGTGTSTATFSPTRTPTATLVPSSTPTMTATSTATSSATGTPTSTATSSPSPSGTPTKSSVSIRIGPAYPNPVKFTDLVAIQVEVPANSTVRWDVFTTAFRKIGGATIPNTGSLILSLDLRDEKGERAANGLYYIRVRVTTDQDEVAQIEKVLLLRD